MIYSLKLKGSIICLFTGLEFHFLELLYKIFTKSFTVKYKNRFGPAWIQMLIDFDQMLISFFTTQDEEDNTPAVALGNSNVKPMLFLPVSFYLEYEKCTGKQVGCWFFFNYNFYSITLPSFLVDIKKAFL